VDAAMPRLARSARTHFAALNPAGALALALLAGAALAMPAYAADTPAKDHDKAATEGNRYFKAEQTDSDGSVTVGNQKIDYRAVVGTVVVHPKDWDDAPQKANVPPPGDDDDKAADGGPGGDHNPTAEAAMSYVAYFKKGVAANARPIMFLYNGGPGSSTVWLHMGAFGPRRVVTLDDQHAPAAPYQLIGNQYSLLDTTDLVFIDAPGTGFGRLAGPNKEKSFYGVDPDAYAFSDFITQFLTKFGRWNSPKYLFGESYGTTRTAVLVNELETERAVDVNGVIMLSQILNFDLSVDGPEFNPGVDLPYELALPTYAATAWYHHKLNPAPKDLKTLLSSAEDFAVGDYARALRMGNTLPEADRQATIGRLHDLTGLPAAYLDRADLRVDGGEFEKTLQDSADMTTGRLDSRFAGPTMDPLSKEADYDPQSAAIGSAYVSAFNDYVRHDLHFAQDRAFRPEADVGKYWSFTHTPPGAPGPISQGVNVMPDLASAMKYNPNLKVLVNGGVYDLATPYFSALWEVRHLQIPKAVRGNISFKTYESGHMVYAHEPALKELHDNVAAFIGDTDNLNGK
jgi:carboxypeptidase C (cathepsin A)